MEIEGGRILSGTFPLSSKIFSSKGLLADFFARVHFIVCYSRSCRYSRVTEVASGDRTREVSLESFKLDWVLVGNWWKILDDVGFPLRIVVNILGWMDKDISILCFKILF